MEEQKKDHSPMSMREEFKERSQNDDFLLGVASALALAFGIGFFVSLWFLLGGSADNRASQQEEAQDAPAEDTGLEDTTAINLAAVTDADWIRGSRDAKVTIVEFSDTECPFCKRFHDTMLQVLKEYDGKVNWVYRHYPLEQLHPKAPKEAEALECAGELAGNDGFWKYADRLYEVTPSNNDLPAEQLPQIAKEIGLTVDAFQACIASGKYADKVQNHVDQATAAGGRGTPYSIIISGESRIPINGALPITQVRSLIDPLVQ